MTLGIKVSSECLFCGYRVHYDVRRNAETSDVLVGMFAV